MYVSEICAEGIFVIFPLRLNNVKSRSQIALFVSPELSSGRDLVIQMSVRRAASAVRRPPSMVFCPEHISGSV